MNSKKENAQDEPWTAEEAIVHMSDLADHEQVIGEPYREAHSKAMAKAVAIVRLHPELVAALKEGHWCMNEHGCCYKADEIAKVDDLLARARALLAGEGT